MAVDRRLLYAGLFLAAVGSVAVAADLAGVERGALLRGLQLWPLALIALGAGIVLRRTSAGLPAGVLAAVAPGLLIGGGFALGPPAAGECAASEPLSAPFIREGDQGNIYSFHFTTGCGTSRFTTQPGGRWRITAARSDGGEPRITDTGGGLSVISPGAGWRQFTTGFSRENLDVVLPTTIETLGITANANETDVSLAGATISLLSLEVNGSNLTIDASNGSVGTLGANVKFGNVSVILPAAHALDGALRVGVGNLRLCQPAGAGLSVRFRGDGVRDVTVAGARWEFDEWESDDFASSPNHTTLSIEPQFASIDINPIGGCS